MENPDVSAAALSRVYVDMVGDLFHAGHVSLLRKARRHGDWLVVGVLSDDTAASYKRRPIMTQPSASPDRVVQVRGRGDRGRPTSGD